MNLKTLGMHMKRGLKWLVAGVVVAVLCVLFPPFRIVSLSKGGGRKLPAAFDAPTFAREFWEKRLLPETPRALDLNELLAALAQDPAAARQRFGRSLGLASTACYFVKGSGKIADIDKGRIRVLLDGKEPPAVADLHTGFLFGNTVRDAAGILNVSEFANSQDFNAVSSELNKIVETEVLPGLRQAASPGKPIRFVGCVELEEGAPPPIVLIIPVKVEWP